VFSPALGGGGAKSFLQGEKRHAWRPTAAIRPPREAAFLAGVRGHCLPFLHGTALLMSALVGADVLVTRGDRDPRLVRRRVRAGLEKGPDPAAGAGKSATTALARSSWGGMLSADQPAGWMW